MNYRQSNAVGNADKNLCFFPLGLVRRCFYMWARSEGLALIWHPSCALKSYLASIILTNWAWSYFNFHSLDHLSVVFLLQQISICISHGITLSVIHLSIVMPWTPSFPRVLLTIWSYFSFFSLDHLSMVFILRQFLSIRKSPSAFLTWL